MKKKLLLSIFMLISSFLVAQCPVSGTQTGNGTFDSSTLTVGVRTQVIAVAWGGEYVTINNMVAGNTYTFDSCGAAYDSEVTVFNPSNVSVGFDSSGCGDDGQVSGLVAPVSGSYKFQVNANGCGSDATDTALYITLTALAGDTTPPAFENSTPSASSVAATSFTLGTDIDEAGTIYYVVVPDGATAPTSANVKAGTASGGGGAVTSGNATVSSGGFTNNFSVISLAAGTAYDVYVVAQDDEGTPNLQTSPTKIDVTTTGKGWTGATNTNWATASNWSPSSIPIASDNLVIPNVTNKPIISSSTGAVANNITIDASSSVTINGGGSLIIEGTATVNGDFIYKVNVTDTNWHLISSPVAGEQFDDTWNNANGINTGGTGNNEAVASYISTSDADGDWVYFQDGGTATTFGAGIGYSVLRTGAGDYTFTGTFPAPPINPVISASNTGNANENRWTLVGNPFPAHVNIATFLSVNATPLTDTHESVYVWNAATSSYDDLTTGYIHPGQGFFVNSNVPSTSVTFTKAMQSDQNGVTFYRNANQQITLNVTDGSKTKSTEINYIANKTTGLDPRFDIGTFTGQASNFNIFTHLVNNSQGVNFKRQTLPNSNYESMIIPVGINAANGNEITFTAEALNLPTEIKVFLEDRETNTFTRLDEDNTEYKVVLAQNLNGIGRFYLHTSASVLSISDATLENVSIYKTDNTNIRIVGLQNNNLTVKIFNVLGKQVLQKSLQSNGVTDISIPNLASGVYIVQLQTDKGKKNKKIILE